MGNCLPRSVISGSMKEKTDPVEEIRPSKRLKSSEPINHGHHGSPSSSPPTMEPSPLDSVHPSPLMDVMETIREMSEKIEPDGEIKPSKRFKSSGSTNAGHHKPNPSSPLSMELSQSCPVDSVHLSPSIDSMEAIREMYEKIDPVEQIDPLISFVENQLHKMNTSSEEGSSSSNVWMETVGNGTKLAAKTIDTISNVWLETVGNGTKLAAKTIDTISTEAEKLSKSDAMEAIGSLTLKAMEGVGNVQCVLIGLCLAACAAQSYMSVCSTENECRQLLLKILQLAKDAKKYSQQMPDERGKLYDAVGTIMEGAVICIDYMKSGTEYRFWSAKASAAQVKKTNQILRDITDSLALCSLRRHWDKDVFLSHSGKQKNFVRQLYLDLSREHISCFFDEDRNSLPLGERFPPLIFKAAEECRIAVMVLYKEFICSKWPMLELSTFIKALKSGKNPNLKLLPIFFMISPKESKELSKIDNPEWQKLDVSDDTKVEWQGALKLVRSINGLHFCKDENEVALRDKVTKAIGCLLNGINRRPHLLDFQPVGIEDQVQEVKALLDMGGRQPALAVIICGFGGVGKSTVAASVVQSLDWSSTHFKFCWVAIDEQTVDRTSHIIKLQKDIINDIEGVKPDLRNPDEGRVRIKEALKRESSLLFIDNVVDKNYVRDLLPKDLSVMKNTKLRILISSREKNVKAELNIKCEVHEMRTLSESASQRLLFETIMQDKMIGDKDFDEESMINEVADACRGVPLLLSVFGKHLRATRDEDSYSKESYEEVLDVLGEGNLDSYRDEDLGTKVMFVYDKIKDVEVKEAFLDICTYFHGWDWTLVVDIVDFGKLEDLRRRTLVSKSRSGEVIVHDILRLMGMKQARLTRFSTCKEFSDALEGNLDGFGNVKDVKGISVVNDEPLITIQSTILEPMHLSLRVLMLGDWVTLDRPLSDKAFTNLRYLRVGDITAFPFKDPSKLSKLKVLLNRSKPGTNLSHLPSNLKRICHEVPDVDCDKLVIRPFQNLRFLKNFTVRTQKSSVELHEELHLPASLVDLGINRCQNLPKDIGHLTALESLILDASHLECLPQGFGHLKKLKHLSMDYCSNLACLSEDVGTLSSLETLSMKGCRNLQKLPESLVRLHIQSLNIHSLVNLKQLGNDFGKMPLLKDLCLESCHSLTSLPESFVHLRMLATLKIIKCTKLSVLPEDFGQLRCLKHMTVEECHLLKELPHGFGALPALITFTLQLCNSFVGLPTNFTELTSLEELRLEQLPLMSRTPDGFGKLKNLRVLEVQSCFKLKTLSWDFENMATLERLEMENCPQLDGSTMEKILKLQNCFMAFIYGSTKLLEKWEHINGETGHPIVVYSEFLERDRRRAIRGALLHGKCIEVKNGSDQLMERSSLLVGLGEGIFITVALIMLPFIVQSNQDQTLQRCVEMARERAETNGSGKLQIVCARKVNLDVERPIPTEEEERAEEEGIRQILLSLPKRSCAILSSEYKRVKVLTRACELFCYHRDELSFFMVNVGVDMKFTKWDAPFPPNPELRMKADNKKCNSLQNFIKSIRTEDEQPGSPFVARENKTEEFMKALKGNGINYLLIDNNRSQMVVDDLHGKAIGFIISEFKYLKYINLQQIYKDLQQKNCDFIWIWIPTEWPKDCGHGSYTRLIECMPWATFPHPQLVNVESIDRPCFVVVDKHGQIANHDAMPLLWAWGLESYPFTNNTIPQSFSLVECDSCLEFLLHGMNIVGRKPIRSKMTFLYAAYPTGCHMMKSKLEESIQIHDSFEVLYVGNLYEKEIYDIEKLKQDYEDAIQNMRWASLSFSDMIMFWYRCKYLANEEAHQLYKDSTIMMETLHIIAKQFYSNRRLLVLVNKDGPVTWCGYDVVRIICKSSDEISGGEGMVKDELIKSLSSGECSPIAKAFLRDEIHDLPLHPQHPVLYKRWGGREMCDVCGARCIEQRSYWCRQCKWYMCGHCWIGICQTAS